MLDARRLLGNLIGGTLSQALGGRGASIFRTGTLGTRANIGIGLLGVAIAAFEHYQQNMPAAAAGATPPPPPPPATGGPPPPPPPARNSDALLLIRAMIAAAQADGRIDDVERARITEATSGLSAAEREFLDAELAAPHSVAQLVAASRPEIAGDVYAAASHAIVADNDVEHAWLAGLGDALRLDAATRQSIESRFSAH